MVDHVSNGTMTVGFAGGTIQLRGDFAKGAQVTLCIRSEDIDIVPEGEQQHCSKETVYVRARVRRLMPSTANVRVALQSDCGRLFALLGKSRSAELDLREGDTVFAAFHYCSIHVI